MKPINSIEEYNRRIKRVLITEDEIKEAIAKLPQKERTIVEYRFYRNMQVKEIATVVGLSSSRVTRIVQSALNNVREYLQERDIESY